MVQYIHTHTGISYEFVLLHILYPACPYIQVDTNLYIFNKYIHKMQANIPARE